MDDPIWITESLAIAIHKRQLAEHGGLDGVRDPGLLQSSLARPRHLFAYEQPTPSIATMAAAYAFGIARNHEFIDGNKRMAAVVCETFLELNGMILDAADVDLYPQFLALAAGELAEADFAAWLTNQVKPNPAE